MWAINQQEKQGSSVTYSTDQEKEVSKVFIINNNIISKVKSGMQGPFKFSEPYSEICPKKLTQCHAISGIHVCSIII